ncbi:MAG: lipid II:glycine glycyltransferase FemX [Candidatus Limnocylindria bacterium]
MQLALSDPEWRSFVDRHPEALPFHLPAWAELVADCYHLAAFVIAVRDAGGAISAGIPVIQTRVPLRPTRLVSLPFTDICPPLAASDADRGRLVAALEVARHKARAQRAEIRGPLPEAAVFEDAGYRHVLRLDGDPATVFGRFHRSQVQRSVRKAEASGLTLRVGTRDRDLLDDFYALHLGTRRRLGVPIQPRRFFSLLRERILRSGIGWVVSVETSGRPIAAALFLASKGTVVYKYGASDADAWRLRPNHLLFWNAIRAACESGHQDFDFGRTDAGADGLRAFKQSWGTEELRLLYHAVGDAAPLPASPAHPGAARRLMGGVIRRSPAWVCRWSGEMLYRFVA